MEPPAIRPVARLQASTKHKAAGCKYTGEPQTCKRDSPRSTELQHQNLKFDASGRSQPAKERGDGSVSEGGRGYVWGAEEVSGGARLTVMPIKQTPKAPN